jgi:hypothetical protein
MMRLTPVVSGHSCRVSRVRRVLRVPRILQEEEEEEEEESLFKADAVNEEDSERDRATQVWRRRRRAFRGGDRPLVMELPFLINL